MPIRYVNSPYGVLPPNYPQLGEEGKRAARLNAVMLQDTPEDQVRAWNFFCDYYLGRQSGGEPRVPRNMFYRRLRIPPPFHSGMIWDMADHDRCVYAVVRSGAKTTVLQSRVIHRILTTPEFRVLVVVSTDTRVKKWLGEIMKQLTQNPRIKEDFGDMKPMKGEGLWSHHIIVLRNGANITGIPVGSQMLGERPDFVVIDDAEYDPDSPVKGIKDTNRISSQLDNLMFSVIDPMLDDYRPGETPTGLFMIGTFLHRGAYIYHMVMTEDDERFTNDRWRRKSLPIGEPFDPQTGKTPTTWDTDWSWRKLLWPDKWNADWIEKKRRSMGPDAFNASYMCNPGAHDANLFTLDPTLSWYSITGGPHPSKLQDPLSSDAKLTWVEQVPKQRNELRTRSEPFGPWAGRLHRMITIDWARTHGPKADFAGVMVTGLDESLRLWLLHLWLGRVNDSELIDRMWRMATSWKVHVCGIEEPGLHHSLKEQFYARLKQISDESGWTPRPVLIKYPTGQDKGSRIANIQWRFHERGWVRLPRDLQTDPPYRALNEQIRDFTRDLSLLKHDDAIDMLGMTHYVPGRRMGQPLATTTQAKSPLEHIRAGELFDPRTGSCYLSGVDACELTLDDWALIERYQEEQEKQEATRDLFEPAGRSGPDLRNWVSKG